MPVSEVLAGIETRMRDGAVFAHHALDGLPDGGERGSLVEEGFDGDFVGGIEHGGQRAADGSGVAGEIDGGKKQGFHRITLS